MIYSLVGDPGSSSVYIIYNYLDRAIKSEGMKDRFRFSRLSAGFVIERRATWIHKNILLWRTRVTVPAHNM